MAKLQVSLKLNANLMNDIGHLVPEGYLQTKNNIFTKTLGKLIGRYKVKALKRKIGRIIKGSVSLINAHVAMMTLMKRTTNRMSANLSILARI